MIPGKKDVPDFSQLVADHYDHLTNAERKISDFIIQNQDQAAFMTAAEIAQTLNISEPTMLRYAHTLGFESYPAFRMVLQAKVRDLVDHSTRMRNSLEDLRKSEDIYEQLVASEITFLTESLQTVDRKALDQAVNLLREHQNIFVFGLGPAVSLVDQLEIRLVRSKHHVIPLRSSGREVIEPLLLMEKNDLLIAIAFHSPNPHLLLVLEHAHELGTPVILITDTLGHMLEKYATVTISARRGPVSSFHSMTIPMTIINALLLSLSSVDQDRILNNLDRLDQLRNKLNKSLLAQRKK